MKKIREASNKESIAIVSLILVSFILGFVVFKIDGIIMLSIGAIIAGVFANYLGHSWENIANSISLKVKEAIPAILILLSIGILVGCWMVGGTIPMMIYYGLKVVNPNYLYLTAFLVSIFISISTGTSWGTVGTIGVALIGVAVGLGAPLPIVAGAIISGAYFGDKMSPLSDTTNMSALAAKADLYKHIKQMTVTTVPAFFISCIVYYILGKNLGTASAIDSVIYSDMLSDLSNNFQFSFLLLLPPTIVIIGAITKKPTVPVLLFSSAVAMLLGFLVQNASISDVFMAAKSGYNASVIKSGVNFSQEVLKLLNRGGAASMFEGAIYVVVAFSFGGILSLTNCLNLALKNIMKPLKSVSSVCIAAGFSATTIVSIAQNSYISYFLVSDIFSKKFNDLKLKEENLSRILEDFVTVLEGLMPWTISGIYMSITLGVSALDFAPYAVFNWSCTLLSILYALTYKSIGKWAFAYKSPSEIEEENLEKYEEIIKEQVEGI
ncbi:MAG: Na+/H+ antiporter NhaC [Cetobacterium sp.]|uniref:Na+/H+ antiporter NhaC n=1 Tax=Cetobacterium sp. TaxID=2071632 RepID=UPI003EE75E6C